MRHMTKVRAASMVVLIGLSAAAFVFGQDGYACYEAYLDSGLSVQQMTYDEFRGAYGETVCATDLASLSEGSSK
jgi:hypothetical protein